MDMKELVVGNPIYDKELKVLGLITAYLMEKTINSNIFGWIKRILNS